MVRSRWGFNEPICRSATDLLDHLDYLRRFLSLPKKPERCAASVEQHFGTAQHRSGQYRLRLQPALRRRPAWLRTSFRSYWCKACGRSRPIACGCEQHTDERAHLIVMVADFCLPKWRRPVNRLVGAGENDGDLVPRRQSWNRDGVVEHELCPWRFSGNGLRDLGSCADMAAS